MGHYAGAEYTRAEYFGSEYLGGTPPEPTGAPGGHYLSARYFLARFTKANYYRPGDAVVEPPAPEPPAPEPSPPAPPTGGHPTGHRVAVRIDGKLYVGDYREISIIIENRAKQDAELRAEESKTKARKSARKLVGGFRSLVQIEQPMLLAGIDPEIIASSMMRDLRAIYNDTLVNAMLESFRLNIEQEEEAAMAAAEALLMGD